ncbi:hypothetical protein CSKR_102792 [Clonorchis sinensis]|uniref:Uncharacterized protein n=1 Tax=Clonorchis sinensis TaxID=79923 RepID=A0A3R7F0M9_CLOSI|nr:hypothetical protein CSKR_102792 [Clonorchis sinensis]
MTETRGLRLPDEPQEGRNRLWAVDEFSANLRVVAPSSSSERKLVNMERHKKWVQVVQATCLRVTDSRPPGVERSDVECSYSPALTTSQNWEKTKISYSPIPTKNGKFVAFSSFRHRSTENKMGTIHNALLMRLLKIRRQPTTCFGLPGARQVGAVPEFLLETKLHETGQINSLADWCSTFDCLETSQTRDSAGFQTSLS